ncbi:hypothetical protein FQZ97_660960 [compost metagenome]
MAGPGRADLDVAFRQVVAPRRAPLQRQQRGAGGIVDVQGEARIGLLETAARPVQAPVAQDDPLQRRGLQHGLFQRGDAADADAAAAPGAQVERLVLAVRQRARRIGPGDALRHQFLRASGTGGGHQVGGAFAAQSRVAADGLVHARRVQPRRQVGQLVDDPLRAESAEQVVQRIAVEHIQQPRLYAAPAQGLDALGRAADGEHLVAALQQQRQQAATDDAGGAGQEDFHAHGSNLRRENPLDSCDSRPRMA